MNIELLSAIAKGAWSMDAVSAQGFMPIINAVRSRGSIDLNLPSIEENRKANTPYSVSAQGGLMESSDAEINPGSVFVAKMSGVLMKNEYCGVPGTSNLRSWLQQADNDDRVVATVICMDTPGGTVNGLQELADTVKSLNKPVYGYVDGMSCSAGYYAMAYADEIFLSSSAACVGSIGTMMSFRNWTNSKEVLGFEDIILNSSYSPDKNKAFMDALEGDYETMIEELDQYALAFREVVKDARPQVQDEALTGKTFLGTEAIEVGLADGIASLEEVCAQILSKHKKAA